MALKPLNSVGGFSVGLVPINIIANTGEITTFSANITGNVITGNVIVGALATNAQPNITSVGTLSSLSVSGNTNAGNFITEGYVSATGNVTGNYILGNGAFLTGIDTSLISNGNSNVQVYSNANIAFTVNGNANVVVVSDTGNVISATGNITAPWFLGNVSGATLTASGNANVANLNASEGVFATTVSATGNVTGGNLVTANGVYSSTVSATGTATVGNLSTAGTANVGTLEVVNNANVGGNLTVGTGSGGNITGANVISANTFIGNVQATTISTTGTANVGNLETTGTISAGGNANVANLGTSGLITAIGNIIGGNISTANLVSAGSLSVTANANIGNIGVGIVTATGNITAPYFIGNFSGNIAGNVQAAGSNTQIQFNDDNILGASSNFTFDKATNDFKVTGTSNITGAAQFGNTVSAAANIDAPWFLGNVSGATLTASGNANVANLNASAGVFANTVSATGTATVGNVSTTGYANVGELAASGNAVISGNLTVNGNLTYVNVDTLAIEDPIIELGTGPNGAPPANSGKDVGSSLNYFTTSAKKAFMGYDLSQNETIAATEVTISGEVVTVVDWGTFRSGNIAANGTLSSTGTATVGNLSTGGTANITGNLTAGNVDTAGLVSSGSLSVTANANIGNIGTGLITASGNVTGANLVTLGTMDSGSANVTGNLTAGNISSLGTISAIGNITAPYFIGNLSGNISGNITAPGSNTQVQFNDNGVSNAVAGFTFDKTTNVVTSTGAFSTTGNVTTPLVVMGDTRITAGTVTTTTTSSTVIAQYPVSGFTGVEFLVKGRNGTKYSVATVQAVTDGTNVDYAIFATLNLVGPCYTDLSVAVSGGNIQLLVTPASSASTVWNTNYRLV